MEKVHASILIVEDDPRQVWLYSKALRGYRQTTVSSGSAALEVLSTEVPDVILLDHVLADGEHGIDFLPQLKAKAAHVPVIVISGTLDIQGRLAALQGPLSAHYVIEKPVDLEELEDTVALALESCGLGEAVSMLQSMERVDREEPSLPDHQFTERLARHHALLRLLRKSQERPNISELARQFHVSRKTIIRDLQDLIRRQQLDEAVYPEWKAGIQEAG